MSARRGIHVNIFPSTLRSAVRHPVVAPAIFLGGSAAGAGAAATVAATMPEDRKRLGHGSEFWNGLSAGIVGAVGLKYGAKALGKTGPMKAAKDGVKALVPTKVTDWTAARAAAKADAPPPSTLARIGKGTAAFVGVTALGMVPSYALLEATSGDRKVLGKGHEFWTGAVWGLAGVATLKAAVGGRESVKHAPLVGGWVASDIAALKLNSALNGSDAKH